jgi:hypothetical protein
VTEDGGASGFTQLWTRRERQMLCATMPPANGGGYSGVTTAASSIFLFESLAAWCLYIN